MRAVQRSVFPGGSPAFFEGEIAPDNTPGERVKSSAPVIDLTARVDALEEQLQALTGQTEQNAYQLRSEEHTSELLSLMRISYAVFCLKKKQRTKKKHES